MALIFDTKHVLADNTPIVEPCGMLVVVSVRLHPIYRHLWPCDLVPTVTHQRCFNPLSRSVFGARNWRKRGLPAGPTNALSAALNSTKTRCVCSIRLPPQHVTVPVFIQPDEFNWLTCDRQANPLIGAQTVSRAAAPKQVGTSKHMMSSSRQRRQSRRCLIPSSLASSRECSIGTTHTAWLVG